MTYFRHPPLAFWTIVLAALLAIGGIGLLVGNNSGPVTDTIVAPSVAPTADIDMLVTQLSAMYPALNSGTGATFAKDYATLAADAHKRHADSGLRPDLDDEWTDVDNAARELTRVDPKDKEKYIAAAGTLGAAVGRLHEAAKFQ